MKTKQRKPLFGRPQQGLTKGAITLETDRIAEEPPEVDRKIPATLQKRSTHPPPDDEPG